MGGGAVAFRAEVGTTTRAGGANGPPASAGAPRATTAEASAIEARGRARCGRIMGAASRERSGDPIRRPKAVGPIAWRLEEFYTTDPRPGANGGARIRWN